MVSFSNPVLLCFIVPWRHFGALYFVKPKSYRLFYRLWLIILRSGLFIIICYFRWFPGTVWLSGFLCVLNTILETFLGVKSLPPERTEGWLVPSSPYREDEAFRSPCPRFIWRWWACLITLDDLSCGCVWVWVFFIHYTRYSAGPSSQGLQRPGNALQLVMSSFPFSLSFLSEIPDHLRLDFLDRSSIHYLLSIPHRLFPYTLAELANLSFSPSTEFSLDSGNHF